jgi:uncharacterized protein with HEPN domain
MPPRDWQMRVQDILVAIEKIQNYTRGMTAESFMADSKTVDAVIANITVIGEAASRVPSEAMQTHPAIPWKVMRDIRNVVVHEYFGLNARILWDTVQNDLPPLVPLLRRLLEKGPAV